MKNLSGPLSIAEYAGESAEAGVGFVPEFSGADHRLSLGFLNLLPIPILDGGQIVFQAGRMAEGQPAVRAGAGRSGSRSASRCSSLLMGVALFNDIARQFS